MTEPLKKYLEKKYSKTKWPFFKAVDLKAAFGEEPIKLLIKSKVIRIRKGMNGYLIELIKSKP
jgi:hypothetical protein